MCKRVCEYMHTFSSLRACASTRGLSEDRRHTGRGAQTTHRLHKIHGHHLARRRRPFAAAGMLLRGRSRSRALDLRSLRFFHKLRAGRAVSGEVCQERFNTHSSSRRAQPATLAPQQTAHSPVAQPLSLYHGDCPCWPSLLSYRLLHVAGNTL